MVESESGPALHEASDPLDEYRSVDRWAVVGLLLGLLSPAAMLSPILVLLSPLGIVTSGVALVRLKRDASRIGRTAALIGLALAVLFGVAPVAQWATTTTILWRQAKPVADLWFELLRKNEPEKAVLLRFAPEERHRMDEDLWLYLRSDKEAKQDLQRFVKNPLVRTLLELGPRADVRLYKTVKVASLGEHALAEYYYTVTFDDADGKKKTFFVSVVMQRKPVARPGLNPWRVHDAQPVDSIR